MSPTWAGVSWDPWRCCPEQFCVEEGVRKELQGLGTASGDDPSLSDGCGGDEHQTKASKKLAEEAVPQGSDHCSVVCPGELMLPFPSKALRECCRDATDGCRRKEGDPGVAPGWAGQESSCLDSAGPARQFLGCWWRKAGSARVRWTAPCAITCCPHPDPLPSLVSPSFGLAPAAPLQVHAPLAPNQSVEISLPLNTVGSVMKMDPLNNLQVRTWGCPLWGAGDRAGSLGEIQREL